MTVDKFNEQFTVGQSVSLVLDGGSVFNTKLRSGAWQLGGGQAVAMVEGKSGGWAIDRIRQQIPEPPQ